MKILHVITSLRGGGAEKLMVDLLPRLREHGLEPELLVFDGTPTPFMDALHEAGIPVHALAKGEGAMRNPLLLPRLRRFLRSNHYDAIHTHNTACQLLTAIAAPKDTTLLTTEHNADNRRRAWRWYKPIDRWMYRRYSRIVCVSDSTRANLLAWLGSEFDGRAVTIPNGIDLSRFGCAEPAPDISMPGKTIVTMVAAFRPQKDHFTLLRAMALLPDSYHLLLAGNWKETLEACHQLAAELGIADRVTFLGMRSDVERVLAASDIAVLSSHYEGLPLSLVEAMASGRPVIGTDVPGINETLAGAGVLVPHEDAQALADAIADLATNTERAAAVGAACKAKAQGYDIAQMAARYAAQLQGAPAARDAASCGMR